MLLGAIGDTAVVERTGDAEGVLVRRFVDGDGAGARRINVSVIDMPVGTVHRLHRHPNAEQVVYVQSGTVEHLTEDARTQMNPGDYVFIPAGEWHGVANSSPVPAMTIVVLGFISDEPVAGYEPHPQQFALPE